MDPVRLLIATDAAADAEPVAEVLRGEFDAVSVSSHPEAAVADFERSRPAVLVLAFQELERSESYYLGLYRLSAMMHAHAHQTVILCGKDHLARVYELCRKDYFNDFILYWPLTYEARYRLLMAVHSALRRLEAGRTSGPSAAAFAEQALGVAELGSVVERGVASGGRRIGTASRSLAQAQAEIGAAVDRLSRRLVDGGFPDLLEVKDAAGLERELDHVRVHEIDRRLDGVTSALRPVEAWARELRHEVAPHLESARALGALAKELRPLVLVVDDDPFQRKVAGRILEEDGLEPVYAENGVSALGAVRRRRPDLVLLDLKMPELDGIAVTRALRSVESLARVPVVMMTGAGSREVVVACREAGASDFVVKPFRRGTLLEKVRSALSGPAPGGRAALEHPRYEGDVDAAQLGAFIEQLGRRGRDG